MVETIGEHPSGEELRAYGQGRLAPEASLVLEEHLAGCARCCALLEQAPGDRFLSRRREAGPPAHRLAGQPTDPGPDGSTVNLVSSVPAELVGHPRYRVLGLVGQGGMGAVYRAEHQRMERVVALKVINPGLME